jgi:hypothetical protein
MRGDVLVGRPIVVGKELGCGLPASCKKSPSARRPCRRLSAALTRPCDAALAAPRVVHHSSTDALNMRRPPFGTHATPADDLTDDSADT